MFLTSKNLRGVMKMKAFQQDCSHIFRVNKINDKSKLCYYIARRLKLDPVVLDDLIGANVLRCIW